MPARGTRRSFLGAMLACAAPPCLALGTESRIVICAHATLPAHLEMVEALLRSLETQQVTAKVLDSSAADVRRKLQVLAHGCDAAVAVGRRALDVLTAGINVPTIATMMLSSELPLAWPPSVCSAITLDLEAPLILDQLRQMAPKSTKLAVVTDDTVPEAARVEFAAAAELVGFQASMLVATSPKDLLGLPGSSRDRADLLVCLPSLKLYHPAVLEPLMLDSIRARVPLVGFSEAFARAGAAAAIYPHYAALGAQTATDLKVVGRNAAVTRVERARKARAALNLRVLRLLGLKLATPQEAVVIG